jgi:betaine lipid synthase
VIPPFHAAVDNAQTLLAEDGFIGVADFYVSSKYDLPLRQMPSIYRWFWRTVFDTDNIDLGPERRQYLDHTFQREWEYNGRGSIPYVPGLLKAPFYVWIGGHPNGSSADVEAMNKRPHSFPPTFLYSLSWEDPRADQPILEVEPGDVALTLTSGACNAFDLALQGAEVYCVDMNPAQSHLLELKTTALRRLPYEDVWQMFGEGHHPQMKELFDSKLAPFMSGRCQDFWAVRLYYFKTSLYFYGAMGNAIWLCYWAAYWVGLRGWIDRLCEAPTLEAQQTIWENSVVVRFIRMLPKWFLYIVAKISLNPFIMWNVLGVPKNQGNLITGDGRSLSEYVATVVHGAAMGTHLATENYFYLCCLTGKFTKQSCPRYLTQEDYTLMRSNNSEMLEKVHNITGSYMDELKKRKYTKVILMDHVDWTDEAYIKTLAAVLYDQVLPGGRVIWRSASKNPWYSPFIAEAGFDVVCVERHHDRVAIDCVNMYASFWVGTRK